MVPNEISGTSIEVRGTDQIQIWDSTLWQAMGGLRSSLIGEAPFFGRARFQDAGHVKICELASSPVCVVRDKGSATNEDREFIKIALQLSGRSRFTQADREVLLDGAGWTFYDTGQPYQVINLTQVHQLVLLVPKAQLHFSAHQLKQYSICKFGVSPGVSGIFHNYIKTILTDGALATADERAALGDVAANLLNLSIAHEARGTAIVSANETLQFQIKHYINKNLTDPDLSAQKIAVHFGYSKRHIHRVFAGNDLSLADYILRARLQKCAQALRSSASRPRTVGDIAFYWGFNNLSHFSRSFRHYFGCTPSTYRQNERNGSLHSP